jgi:hypothetical protein
LETEVGVYPKNSIEFLGRRVNVEQNVQKVHPGGFTNEVQQYLPGFEISDLGTCCTFK